MKTPDIYCVLGMHRSGTSLLTRILGFLGVHLGREDAMYEPLSTNPKGHWEYLPFLKINGRLLRMHGGNWVTHPRFPAGWLEAPEVQDLALQAKAFAKEEFGSSSRWAWKDPRTCFTLPFWKGVFPGMRHVLVFRNPLEVALSLKSRNYFPVPFGAGVWLQHVHRSLAHTQGEPRHLLFYEEFLENWQDECERLARFIGEDALENLARNRAEIVDFMDQELRHQKAAPSDIAGSPLLPGGVKTVYGALKAHVRKIRESKEGAVTPAEEDRLLEIVSLAERELKPTSRGDIKGAVLRGYDGLKRRIKRAL